MGKFAFSLPSFMKNAILDGLSLRAKLFWTLASVILPTLLRWIIDRGEAGMPFVTFFPAIMLSSIFLGWRCAIVTAFSAALIGNRIFRGHPGLLHGDGMDFVLAGLFALSCTIMIVSGEVLRKSIRKIDMFAQTQTILSAELRHRMRNTLQIVQSFAEITARLSPPEEFLRSFSARLAALSIATDQLTSDVVRPCCLRELIKAAIKPFHGTGQFHIQGPDCALSRELCFTIALALHELCTNALKYGALSVQQGYVEIEWAKVDSQGKQVRLTWKETGGPRVEPPVRRGMGTILLESQSELGIHSMNFHPEGFECEMNLKILE